MKTLSKRTRLAALRDHATTRDKERFQLLLEETDYETYPSLLTRSWWTKGLSPDEAKAASKTAAKVVRYLLDTIPAEALPPEIAKRIPSSATEKNQAVLKLQTSETLKLKPQRRK